MMKLDWLIRQIPEQILCGREVEIPGDVLVSSLIMDSRQVIEGSVFVAVPGEKTDGHQYIPQALERGAAAIVGMKNYPHMPVCYVRVKNSRQALAYLASAYYQHPARKLRVVGVTGTDGKTTTANLIYQILTSASVNTGMISTVNAVLGKDVIDTGFHVTTPEALEVQKYLYHMVENKPDPITHAVIESTSHGLAQHRLTSCEFDIGVLTNITHEHLDYHKTMDKYRAAKFMLFSHLAETSQKDNGNIRLAVLNRDDDSYRYLSDGIAKLEPRVFEYTYGLHKNSNLRAEKIEYNQGKISFWAVDNNAGRFQIIGHLPGLYNIHNYLAAIATTVEGLNIPIEYVTKGIDNLRYVPGRMEQIDLGQEFLAIVDFAHTPNALSNALKTAREMTDRRLIAVLGSAGLRDREKRSIMAQVAVQLADLSIFTAEDPRSESVEDILRTMADAAMVKDAKRGADFNCIPDRREAIRWAVSSAKKDDVIIILGKGHEQSMCFGQVEYPWDDRTAVRSAISKLLGIDGPEMPFLPEEV
jgi:UDP-N-acetylmuramoyl-L-alanyl-D-glutamate--2,6-diaminopimelate ligase